MALNFFDYEQLTKGAVEGEREERLTRSSRHTPKPSNEEGTRRKPRTPVPELRRLHSETALRAHAKGLNEPLSPRSPPGPLSPQQSRPATSRTGYQEQRPRTAAGPAPQKEKRADASPSHGEELSSETTSRPKSLRRRSMQSLRRLRATSKSREREGQDHAPHQGLPESSGHGAGSGSRTKSGKEKATSAEPPTTRSRANTMRNKAANILQQLTALATSKPEQPSQPPPVPVASAPLTTGQARFLAESLAHVTVGEWLFKDHNRPSLIPRANPFRRQIGPPPRGSTGLPQKRWFRISPYDRKVMWSSKWDASSLDQLKTSRQGKPAA
jgi:Meiotic cell cortex C-terminal pleckstrin homology